MTEATFAERYRLVGRRGTGLDVALFEAVDLGTDRTVAVKIVHPATCALPGFVEAFRERMAVVAALRHPNLPEVLDHGTSTWNGEPVEYVVTENLTGGSLRDLRDRGRTLTPSQAVLVGLEACRALDVAHRAGLVHGDLRPTTLVFGADGRLRLADLGVGGPVAAVEWADPAQLSPDRARFASPEQASGAPATARSDVYALSLCLLEAVTGHLPFVGDSTVATLANRVHRLLPVSADLGPLASVLEHAGRPEPDDRFSAPELGRALVQCAEKLPRPAPIPLLTTGLFADGERAAAPVHPSAIAPAVASPSIIATEPSIVVADPLAAVGPTGGDAPAAAPTAPAAVNGRHAGGGPAAAALATGVGDEHDGGPAAGPQVVPPVAPPAAGDADALVVAPVPPPPPTDDEPPLLREPRSRRRLLLVALVVLVAVAAGSALAWFLSRPQTHTVPDLVGMEQGAALNMISEFGWEVLTAEEFDDAVPLHHVLATDPPAGTELRAGRELTLVVSRGPSPRVLPEITGLTVEEAAAALAEERLLLRADERVPDEEVPAGVVLSWSVPSQPSLVAGDTVLPDTLVAAVVSSGPAPRLVPDMTGVAVADAVAQLEAQGLVVVRGADEHHPTVPPGGVARQDPPPGTEVPRGATVTLVVSLGTETVTIPPLADLTLDEARAALEAAGLVVGEVRGDPAGVNVLSEVDGRSIGAGEVFRRGTAIDLTFAVPAE